MELFQTLPEMLDVAQNNLQLGRMALGAGLVGGLAAAHARWPQKPWGLLLMVVAVIAGGAWAWERRALVDDAFITFRYVRNFLEGHGLVYNIGERVEGYTNFLWAMLVAGGAKGSGASIPHVALVLGAMSWFLRVMVVWQLGRVVSPTALPVAAALLAVDRTATSYATTGLETGFTGLLVDAGLLGLVLGPRVWPLAGFAFALATLTRPDMALFYAIGGLWVVWRTLRTSRPGPAVGFFSPGLLVVAHILWRFSYYGEIVPNTYFAKSAGGWHVDQGLVYLAQFVVSSHLVVLAPIALWGWFRIRDPAFRVFTAISMVLYTTYVLKVGGDFMAGRFFLVLMGMFYVCVESALQGMGKTTWVGAGALGLVLGGVAHGVQLPESGRINWNIADENTIYEITRLHPLVIGHTNYRDGLALKRSMKDQGFEITIGTCCIGMVGYYSELPLVDHRGLTDKTVAKQPIQKRGRPGHEKYARLPYLRKRGVTLAWFRQHPKRYQAFTEVDLVANTRPGRWHLLRYDADLMASIAKRSPEIGFTRFEAWLDNYLSDIAAVDTAQLQADLDWFDLYYFEHNDDPKRRSLMATELEGRLRPEPPSTTGVRQEPKRVH